MRGATQPPTEAASHLFDDWFDPISPLSRVARRNIIASWADETTRPHFRD
jgi:hypothetical protein